LGIWRNVGSQSLELSRDLFYDDIHVPDCEVQVFLRNFVGNLKMSLKGPFILGPTVREPLMNDQAYIQTKDTTEMV
jgi:hypothetical protein